MGGEIPYGSGSQRFVLTQAQRKEYPPIQASTGEEKNKNEGILIREPVNALPEQNLINLCQNKSEEHEQPPAVRCSVIQRVPSSSPGFISNSSRNEASATYIAPLPPSITPSRTILLQNLPIFHQRSHHHHHPVEMQPEQEHPIDYHVPKKRDLVSSIKRGNNEKDKIGSEEEEDKKIKRIDVIEERDRRIREAKRAILHKALLHHIRSLPPGSPMVRRLAGIIYAAAGHGR